MPYIVTKHGKKAPTPQRKYLKQLQTKKKLLRREIQLLQRPTELLAPLLLLDQRPLLARRPVARDRIRVAEHPTPENQHQEHISEGHAVAATTSTAMAARRMWIGVCVIKEVI